MKHPTSSMNKIIFGGGSVSGSERKSSVGILMGGSKNVGGLFVFIIFNLIVQLGITYYVMMKYWSASYSPMLFLSQIFVILILASCDLPYLVKFILLSAFSVALGIVVGRMSEKNIEKRLK
jgi:hypothetical protein